MNGRTNGSVHSTVICLMSELKRAGWMLVAGIPFGGLFLQSEGSVKYSDLIQAIVSVPFFTVAMFLMLLIARLPVFRVTGGIVWTIAIWGGYLFVAVGVWGTLFGVLYSGTVSTEALHSLEVGLGISLGYNLARKIDSIWQAKINEWTGI